MVSLEEIKAKRKLKILLKGSSAVGKTHACIKVADAVLKAGKKVLYLDHERGAIEEIVRYFESNNITDLNNFYHEDYTAYMDLYEKIKRYTDKNMCLATGKGPVDLIIIDPMPLLQLCRISATEQIKKQGFYYQGDMKVHLVDMEDPSKYTGTKYIDNRITYSLRGWQYSLPNDWEMAFKDVLVSITPDLVCTLMLPDEKNTLDGCFDFIYEFNKTEEPVQQESYENGNLIIKNITKNIYRGIPKKVRGAQIKEFAIITDPWRLAVEIFNKKYSVSTDKNKGEKDIDTIDNAKKT